MIIPAVRLLVLWLIVVEISLSGCTLNPLERTPTTVSEEAFAFHQSSDGSTPDLPAYPPSTTSIWESSTPVPKQAKTVGDLLNHATQDPAVEHSTTRAAVQDECSFGSGSADNFSNLHFVGNPNIGRQMVFAGGTEEVFAVWHYKNMAAGDLLKRIWLRDGEVWLVREERWDLQKYGSEGTRSDVSIYDFEGIGLDPGHYELRMCINNQWASFGASFPDFQITSLTSIEPTIEPGGERVAQTLGGRLIVQEEDGTRRELVKMTEIADLTWFPDGHSIVFSNRLYANHYPNNLHIAYELWLINAENGELTFVGENLRNPKVSPTGRFIALVSGAGAGDACFFNADLSVLTLDENKQPLQLYTMVDFAGLPHDALNRNVDYYPLGSATWQNEYVVDVPIYATCYYEGAEDTKLLPKPGVYRINMITLIAERIGDLPD